MSASFRVDLAGQSIQFRFQNVSFAGIREIVSADVSQDIAARAAKAQNGADFASIPDVRKNIGIGYATPPLYVSNYASFAAAVTAWASAGGTLVVDQDLTETAAISVNLVAGQTYRMVSDKPRTITYNGANIQTYIKLTGAAGCPLYLDADLIIDCQNKASTGLWLEYSSVSGDDRRDLRLHNLQVRNVKMTTTTTAGANGIRLNGGFDFMWVRNWRVETVNRTAGTGLAGSYGCAGLIYNVSAGSAKARRTVIEDFEVDTVTTEDAAGTAAYSDCDGILWFDSVVDSAPVEPPVIRRGVIRECAGRAIKVFSRNSPQVKVQSIAVYRSVQGVNGGSNDIDIQSGGGLVDDIVYHYSGDAHATPTIPLDFTLGYDLDPGPLVIRAVRMNDSTGATKGAVLGFQYTDPAVPAERKITVENVVDHGQAECLFIGSGVGSLNRADISLRQVDVYLTQAVCKRSDNGPYLFVTASQVLNRASSVPAVRNLSNVMFVVSWGYWVGDATIRGLTRYTGLGPNNAAFTNGFAGPGGGVEAAPTYGSSEVAGRVVFPVVEIASGASYAFPGGGQYQTTGGGYSFGLWMMGDYAGYGIAETTPGVTSWSSIKSPPSGAAYGFGVGQGVVFVNGGSGTGAGSDIEIIKATGTSGPTVINNTAGAIKVQGVLNP